MHVRQAHTPQELTIAASAYGHTFDTTDDISNIMYIEETIPEQWDNATYQRDVQVDCFNLQKVFWQRYPDMPELIITIQGPKVGGGIVVLGTCGMKQVNGSRQPWDDMTAAMAWNIYDFKSITSAIAS
jgi:hypothetical protein